MTTHTGAIRSAEDLLAWIPHGLGQWPTESLVVLGRNGRDTGGLLRLDLPSSCPAALGGEIGRYVHDIFAPTGATGVFLVVYTATITEAGASSSSGRAAPGPLLHRVTRTLGRLGLRVHECLYVTGEGWGRIDVARSGGRCTPPQPLTGITDSVLNTELVFAGHAWGSEPAVLPERASGPATDEVRRWVAAHDPSGAPDPPDDAWARRVVAVWDRELTARPVGVAPSTTGLLLAGLRSRTIRDLLLFQAAAGPSTAITDLVLSAARTGAAGGVTASTTGSSDRTPPRATPDATLLAEVDAGREAPEPPEDGAGGLAVLSSVIVGSPVSGTVLTPDWGRLDAAHALLSGIAPHAEGDGRCAALTLLGWIEFARGRGTRAHHYLEAALEDDPRYELARLFERFLDLGQVHAWARTRQTAWTPDRHPAR